MSSSGNPRKFSEKIALQQQKLMEQQREFDAVMREVEDVTKKKESPPIIDQYGDVGLEYVQAQNFQGSNFSPVSLPDYSTVAPGSRGIDLAGALRNLQSLTYHSPLSPEYNNDRMFLPRQADPTPIFSKPPRFEPDMSPVGLASPTMLGSQQNIPGGMMSFGMQQPPGPFLPLPMESNWRRTHSDSSLHATVMGATASTSAAAGGSPAPPVSHQVNTDSMGRDRRKQNFSPKTQSTVEQYNNGYVPPASYSLVSPMASLSVKPPSSRPMSMVHSPTGVDTDSLKRYDSANSLHINGGAGVTIEPPRTPQTLHQQHNLPRVPNHQTQYDPMAMAGDGGYSAMPPPPPHGMRSSNPITAMLGNADVSLLNTSSLPDLTVALARGSALPSGFPIGDQYSEMNALSRSPQTSRVHKHRIPRQHATRPSLLTQRNQHSQNMVSYLGNGGRSISNADMVALTSGDNSLSNNSGPLATSSNAQSVNTQDLGGSVGNGMPSNAVRYQIMQQQQQFERRFDRISFDPSSSFNYQQQQQQLYQMYPEQPVGLNQRIPEICIETADDQLHHQQLLQQQQLHASSPGMSTAQQHSDFASSPHQQFSVTSSSSPVVGDQNSSMFYETNIFDGTLVGTVDMNSVMNEPSATSYGQQQQHFYMSPSPTGIDQQQQQQNFQSWQS